MDNEPIRVLLIEDSVFATQHTKKMLAEAKSSQFSVELRCVDRVSLGLEHLVEGGTDIVLLDLTLPDSDGLKTFTRVHDHAPQVPIVVMSGVEDERLALEAVQQGAQDYLVKGRVDSNLLKRSILYAIGRKQVELKVGRLNRELERSLVELRAANIQLKEFDRLKSQFLANMSHELRTPLNSIIGFTGIILQGLSGEISDEQRKQLEMVYGSGKHLLTLINDVLDLSKISAGKMEVIPETFHLAEVIDSAIAMITPLANSKGLKLLNTNMPPPDFEIHTDKNKVKQILINLLNNAVKYSQTGQIEVNTNFSSEGNEIEIGVSDTGMGIKKEALNYIFDEFRQAEGTVVKDGSGVGLGLSISKKLVDLLKGKIRVESKYGLGSKFTFSLPLQAAPAKAVITTVPRIAEGAMPLVLTIEDDPKAQELLRIHLEDSGYRIIQAYTAKEAIDLAKEHKPYAITLDILMPSRDGWDILQELKSMPETANIPVIIVSIMDNRELGLSMGAVAYLVKPVEPDELIRALADIERENGIKLNKVLVIDDNPTDTEFVAALLEEARINGKVVLRCYGGLEGVRLARRHRPDLIILDLVMPDVDGFEVIKRLRRSERTRNIPVLIVTAKDLSKEEQEFLRENIQSIMIKGKFTKEELMRSIKETLARIRKE